VPEKKRGSEMPVAIRRPIRVKERLKRTIIKGSAIAAGLSMLSVISIQGSSDRATATWNSVVDLTTAQTHDAPSQLAMSKDGTKAISVWTGTDLGATAQQTGEGWKQVYSKLLNGTQWLPADGPNALWNGTESINFVGEPDAAMAGDGTIAMIIARKTYAISLDLVDTSTGSWAGQGPYLVVDTTDKFVFSPKIKVSDDGTTVLVAWQQSETSNGARSLFAVAGTLNKTDYTFTWGTPFEVATDLGAGTAEVFSDTEVALSSDGSKAHLVWTEDLDKNVKIRALAVSSGGNITGAAASTVNSTVGTYTVQKPKLAVDDAGEYFVVAYGKITTSFYGYAVRGKSTDSGISFRPENYSSLGTSLSGWKVAITSDGVTAAVAFKFTGVSPRGRLERRLSTSNELTGFDGNWAGSSSFDHSNDLVDFSMSITNGSARLEEAYAWSHQDLNTAGKFHVYVATTHPLMAQLNAPIRVLADSSDSGIRPRITQSSNGEKRVVVWNNNPKIQSATYVAPPTKPAAPTGVSATAGQLSANVSWTSPGGTITGFKAYVSGDSSKKCEVGPTETSCTINGLIAGNTYTFLVVAVNSGVNSDPSTASNSVTVQSGISAPESPGAPEAVVSGSGTVTLSWTASTGATGYTVTSSPAGATCTVITTTATCTGLTNGTAYTFSVAATNSGGSSSAVAASAVTPLAVPGTPTGASATGGLGTATVSWTAPANDSTNVPETYTVTASPGGETCTATHPTVTCSVSGLTAGDYTFSVTATNVGGTSAASIATSSVTVTAGAANNNNGNSSSSNPPAPTINLSALNGSGSNGPGGALATASAGQTFTLTGTGMNNVNQVNVGNKKAIITLKTATKLGFRLPKNLPAGTYDLSLYGSFGSMTEAKFFSVAKKKVTQIVAGFGGNSPALNEVVKAGISRTLARLGGGVTLVCNGSTSGVNVTKAAKELARDRARAACAEAKKANPSLTTKIRISPASAVGAQARNVKLVYRNY
jgi:hypothetical protein